MKAVSETVKGSIMPMRSPGSFFPRHRRWDRRHSGEVTDEALR
jgi:hypothetical protein